MHVPGDEQPLRAWLAFRKSGLRAALVTLVCVDGSSPRPMGSQMAVCEDGRSVGYITGGCAEAALASEAIEAIAAGESRIRRFGKGSPYIDVRLPCGSGIDVFFDVAADAAAVEEVLNFLSLRRATTLEFGVDADDARCKMTCADQDQVTGFDNAGRVFMRAYHPPLAIDIVGKGPIAPALARIAYAAGFHVRIASPETETLAAASAVCRSQKRLSSPTDYDAGQADRWTAIAVLFHEHDWDPPVLVTALASNAFYIGALGSRKTQAERASMLRDQGVSAADAARIRGPIGLDIGGRSPEEIAVSILAEVIAVSNDKPRELKCRE